MRCPFCGQDKDKVIDSRATDAGAAIRRRRQCIACGRRFTTYEHVEEAVKLAVVKKDGNRVPFDRAKLLAGLQAACYKRPVSPERLLAIATEVEEELFRLGVREIESVEIGRSVAEKLKAVDQVAYVRFASVYKQFRDLDDLLEEVREVIESSDPRRSPDQGQLF